MSVPSFMDGMTEKLLRRVLVFYAYPGSWSKPFGKSKRTPRAVRDSGRLAKAALKAQNVGAILCVTCDILDVALTELGRKCNIPDPRVTEIARGVNPTDEEFRDLVKELDKMYEDKFPKYLNFL
jgi:hypothetical protein